MNTTVELSKDEKRLVQCMQLLGDPTRYKLYKLVRSDSHELCVSELAEKLGITVSAVSQHFKSFELIGLVEKKRQGQKICYQLRKDNLFLEQLTTMIKLGDN